MIFALALASNLNPYEHLNWALQQLKAQGELLAVSPAYEMMCRDGVGADYLNAACLFESDQFDRMSVHIFIRDLELRTGRVRPSHQISLDVDLIAWKESEVQPWQFNTKKMPFAVDVKVPLYDILPLSCFQVNETQHYKHVQYSPSMSKYA